MSASSWRIMHLVCQQLIACGQQLGTRAVVPLASCVQPPQAEPILLCAAPWRSRGTPFTPTLPQRPCSAPLCATQMETSSLCLRKVCFWLTCSMQCKALLIHTSRLLASHRPQHAEPPADGLQWLRFGPQYHHSGCRHPAHHHRIWAHGGATGPHLRGAVRHALLRGPGGPGERARLRAGDLRPAPAPARPGPIGEAGSFECDLLTRCPAGAQAACWLGSEQRCLRGAVSVPWTGCAAGEPGCSGRFLQAQTAWPAHGTS